MVRYHSVLRCFFVLLTGQVALFGFTGVSVAQDMRAEAVLQVRAEIVRCVTQDERRTMCRERELCCDLVDEDYEELAAVDDSAGESFAAISLE